jgi:hypothetical protein
VLILALLVTVFIDELCLYNVTLMVITDFRLSKWLIIDINVLLHRVGVSEVYDLLTV